MNGELGTYLKLIKEKTGIDINAFSESMKFFVSTREKDEIVLPPRTDFQDVLCDSSINKTFFKFRFRNANLFGSIEGASEIEKNYAHLILALIENSFHKEIISSKTEYIKNILLGDTTRSQTQKFMRKFLVPDIPCYALSIVTTSGRTNEVFEFMEHFVEHSQDFCVLTEEMGVALVRFETASDLSPAEYSALIIQSILEETAIEVEVGIGSIVPNLLDVNTSFIQGVAALRMSRIFSSKSSIHSYKEYVLVKMLEEIPKFKLMEYLDILAPKEAKQVFGDEDMLSTAEEFLDSSLNVSETSRKLFMHRNTLMYRLDKIEKLTGLNIKNFPDAVTFRLITILIKLMNIK